MNRLKLIGHKWYVFFVTLKHVMQMIFAASERIAGLRVNVFFEEDLENLEQELAKDEEEGHLDNVDPKDLN